MPLGYLCIPTSQFFMRYNIKYKLIVCHAGLNLFKKQMCEQNLKIQHAN